MLKSFLKKPMFKLLFIVLLSSSFSFMACGGSSDDDDGLPVEAVTPAAQQSWTIMIYGDGDNNLEDYLLQDVAEMKSGFVNDMGYNLIILVDRYDGTATTGFGEGFTGTRLYRIQQNSTVRISGGEQFPGITTTYDYEANMGDANTLKKFIQSCKTNYPADNYALILWNHGSGPRKKSTLSDNETITKISPFKSVCSDDTNDDTLYTAEITDVLTANESVDLLGFDACLMGSIEIAYQYSPGNSDFNAQYMVASPASEWGYGWKYDEILKRLRNDTSGDSGGTNNVAGSGNEQYFNPTTMSTLDLAGVIVEEQYDSTTGIGQTDQTLSCYDLSKTDAVKTAVDTLATAFASESSGKTNFENFRGSGSSPNIIHYFDATYGDEWVAWPFFDLYDLCAYTYDATFGSIQGYANNVMTALDGSGSNSGLIKYSFGGSEFSGYSSSIQNGKNGIFIFFPDGDGYNYSTSYRDWAYQWWYNSIDTAASSGANYLYGKLAWCIDNATSGNNTADNWFEMLDKWFDINNLSDGGYNGYQY